MKVLFIGGNGNISWNCVQKLIESGYEVWELNRSVSRVTRRSVQPQVHQIICDIRDKDLSKEILKNQKFDVVCDFICYNDSQAITAVELFEKITDQYIYISSECVYKRKSYADVYSENSEKYSLSEVSGYIHGKVSAESVFESAYRKSGFPVTIVRPGYTFDTIMPVSLDHNCFTAMQKVLDGYPMLMYGDGENLWSPLHSLDFAAAFQVLVGNHSAIGQAYNIINDTLISVNQMAEIVLDELGVKQRQIIHIPYEEAIRLDMVKDKEIFQQHMYNYKFDNSKIKKAAPGWKPEISFREGIRSTISWLSESAVRRRIDANFDKDLDLLYQIYWRQ